MKKRVSQALTGPTISVVRVHVHDEPSSPDAKVLAGSSGEPAIRHAQRCRASTL